MADDLDETMERVTRKVEAELDDEKLPPWYGVDIGASVLYELYPGVERPAVVVRSFPAFKGGEPFVNLCVFLDGKNDEPLVRGHYGYVEGSLTLWCTSVHYAPGVDKAVNTWHWPLEGGE